MQLPYPIMKEPFSHDMRAVFAAPGKGLSLKKITAATFFLLFGYVLYTICTYMALLFDGVSFEYIWESYAFFPIKLFPFDSLIAFGLYALGLILAALCLSMALMAVAMITFEELRGNFFFSFGKAVSYSFKRLPTLALGFISLLLFIGFIYLLGVITGLIGRIPFIGEVAIGVFYIVPVFITLAFTVFIIYVTVISTVLFPIILAAQRRREVFDGLLQLFAVVIREPVRFIWYTALSAFLAKVSSFVLAYLFYRTVQFSQLVLIVGGGERVENMFNAALGSLPFNSKVVVFMTNIFPGIDFGFDISRWGYGRETTIGSVLLAISIFILFAFLCGYMISVFSTGMARGYAVIRRMKDEYFIVDEMPMEPAEEFANPPFQSDDSDPDVHEDDS